MPARETRIPLRTELALNRHGRRLHRHRYRDGGAHIAAGRDQHHRADARWTPSAAVVVVIVCWRRRTTRRATARFCDSAFFNGTASTAAPVTRPQLLEVTEGGEQSGRPPVRHRHCPAPDRGLEVTPWSTRAARSSRRFSPQLSSPGFSPAAEEPEDYRPSKSRRGL